MDLAIHLPDLRSDVGIIEDLADLRGPLHPVGRLSGLQPVNPVMFNDGRYPIIGHGTQYAKRSQPIPRRQAHISSNLSGYLWEQFHPLRADVPALISRHL